MYDLPSYIFTFVVMCPDSFYNKYNLGGYYDLGGNV